MGVGLSQACLKKEKKDTVFDMQRLKRREMRPGRVIWFALYVCFVVVFVLSPQCPNPAFSYKHQEDTHPILPLQLVDAHYLSSDKHESLERGRNDGQIMSK